MYLELALVAVIFLTHLVWSLLLMWIISEKSHKTLSSTFRKSSPSPQRDDIEEISEDNASEVLSHLFTTKDTTQYPHYDPTHDGPPIE